MDTSRGNAAEKAGYRVSSAVAAASRSGGAVVALETAVLTHGLPAPAHLEAVQRMARAVSAEGAVPAVVAVLDGQLRAGLEEEELARLAELQAPEKLSARDLSWALAAGASGGTTVAGTLVGCRLAGIRVFATGGIGGVHAGWARCRDISSDLEELARTPCCVVSSGAKSILDVGATLEALESLSVPVLGWRTDAFPQFHSRGCTALPVPRRADDLDTVARCCQHRWDTLHQPGGVLLANPVPAGHALPQQEVEQAAAEARARAESEGVRGAALTPFLLDAVAALTGGLSVEANCALLEANAALAGRVAVALAASGGPAGLPG